MHAQENVVRAHIRFSLMVVVLRLYSLDSGDLERGSVNLSAVAHIQR